MKKRTHPFAMLAPCFALGAFALTAWKSWMMHADPLSTVLRGALAFFVTFYFVRVCASFLGPAEPAAPRPAEETPPAPEHE